MDDLSDVTRLPDDFDGRVRLFPLPGLVLFPHAMQPLHIFEPRYCEMLQESLAGDRLIAMATVGDEHSSDNAGQPPVESTVCIGRIISHAEVEHDRHNILLVGTKRAILRRELETGRAFRMAEVEVLDDVYPPSGAAARRELKKQLLDAFAAVVPATENVEQNLHELMAGQMGLGPITDIIAYTLPFQVTEKLEMLGEADVDARAKSLTRLLREGTIHLHSVTIEEQEIKPEESSSPQQGEPGFPPPFSLN